MNRFGGGIGTRVLGAVIGFLGLVIIAGMLLQPTFGREDTAKLFGTFAVSGGQSTGMTLEGVVDYAKNIPKGRAAYRQATKEAAGRDASNGSGSW